MNKIGKKWAVVANLIKIGSLGSGTVRPADVKDTWQRIMGAKSNARPYAASVGELASKSLAPEELSLKELDSESLTPEELTRQVMINSLRRNAKSIGDIDTDELERMILSWKDGNLLDEVDNDGALRPITTALGTLGHIPRCDGDPKDYSDKLKELSGYVNENWHHIQYVSWDGLRDNAACPYTKETVKGFTKFLENCREMMDEVVRLAPKQQG